MRLLRNAGLRLRLNATKPSLQPDRHGRIAFLCNLCNAPNRVAPALLSRETASCAVCGSTVRFRSIVQLLLQELLGEECTLPALRSRSP